MKSYLYGILFEAEWRPSPCRKEAEKFQNGLSCVQVSPVTVLFFIDIPSVMI